jgi:hypothetical protein
VGGSVACAGERGVCSRGWTGAARCPGTTPARAGPPHRPPRRAHPPHPTLRPAGAHVRGSQRTVSGEPGWRSSPHQSISTTLSRMPALVNQALRPSGTYLEWGWAWAGVGPARACCKGWVVGSAVAGTSARGRSWKSPPPRALTLAHHPLPPHSSPPWRTRPAAPVCPPLQAGAEALVQALDGPTVEVVLLGHGRAPGAGGRAVLRLPLSSSGQPHNVPHPLPPPPRQTPSFADPGPLPSPPHALT